MYCTATHPLHLFLSPISFFPLPKKIDQKPKDPLSLSLPWFPKKALLFVCNPNEKPLQACLSPSIYLSFCLASPSNLACLSFLFSLPFASVLLYVSFFFQSSSCFLVSSLPRASSRVRVSPSVSPFSSVRVKNGSHSISPMPLISGQG